MTISRSSSLLTPSQWPTLFPAPAQEPILLGIHVLHAGLSRVSLLFPLQVLFSPPASRKKKFLKGCLQLLLLLLDSLLTDLPLLLQPQLVPPCPCLHFSLPSGHLNPDAHQALCYLHLPFLPLNSILFPQTPRFDSIIFPFCCSAHS